MNSFENSSNEDRIPERFVSIFFFFCKELTNDEGEVHDKKAFELEINVGNGKVNSS